MKVSTPWSALGKNAGTYIDQQYYPPDTVWSDPSHMSDTNSKPLLKLWRQREDDGERPFMFRGSYSNVRQRFRTVPEEVMSEDSNIEAWEGIWEGEEVQGVEEWEGPQGAEEGAEEGSGEKYGEQGDEEDQEEQHNDHCVPLGPRPSPRRHITSTPPPTEPLVCFE